MATSTIPLADVDKLEGLQIDAQTLANSNLLLVRENVDKSKDIIQFNLKDQVLNKIDGIDTRLGLFSYENEDEETISPLEGSVCYVIEDNMKNIEQIWDNIGSEQPTDENPNGTGIYRRIKLLEKDTDTLLNTEVHKGYQIQLVNAENPIEDFGVDTEFTYKISPITTLNIQSAIENYESYSFNLELTLLAYMNGSSVNTTVKNKYVSVNTIFNLNSIYHDGEKNKGNVGVIQLPGNGVIFVEFTFGVNTIGFKNILEYGLGNYDTDKLIINNAILHINKLHSITG